MRKTQGLALCLLSIILDYHESMVGKMCQLSGHLGGTRECHQQTRVFVAVKMVKDGQRASILEDFLGR